MSEKQIPIMYTAHREIFRVHDKLKKIAKIFHADNVMMAILISEDGFEFDHYSWAQSHNSCAWELVHDIGKNLIAIKEIFYLETPHDERRDTLLDIRKMLPNCSPDAYIFICRQDKMDFFIASEFESQWSEATKKEEPKEGELLTDD